MTLIKNPISRHISAARCLCTSTLHRTVLMIGISMSWSVVSWSQTGEILIGPNEARKNSIAPPAGVLPSEAFRYIPPTGAAATRQVSEATNRSTEQQRIFELNTAGDYQAAGTHGLALLANEKLDDELLLIVANSLAWTGRMKEAIPTYQGLTGGKYANEANIGLANVFRWSGREDQAAPLYRTVLVADPSNKDAIEGLEIANRELRPRTTVTFAGSSDSSNILRLGPTVNHRWRDAAGTGIMEIETSAVKDALPTFQAKQQDVTFRYHSLELPLKPSLEISAATKTSGGVYGSGRINLFDDQLTIQAGRMNWGRIATNPNGLAANLSAWNIGLTWNQRLPFGRLLARANYYDISDGNTIMSSSVNLVTSWRPLGRHIMPFVGIETRDAKFNSPNYWSPAQGYGTAYAGILGEWDAQDWNLYSSAQVGVPLYGEAGNSWNVLVGGKRWITSDVSVGLSAGMLSSTRDSAVYRARSANVSVEKLWK